MKNIETAMALAACLIAASPTTCKAQADTIAVEPLAADTTLAPPDTLTALTLGGQADSPRTAFSPYKFHPAQIAAPAVLIGVGIIGLESDWLKGHNTSTRDELQEHMRGKMTLDDVTQYVPMAANYGLRLCGVKGLHGYGDLTIILGTSYALMSATVSMMKNVTRVERPDGSAMNSFPSGHTATAFLGAELLRREYWGVSPWIGVAGYAVAAGTGFFRMYNNRHWLTDVIAGAGVGILSVQAGYWLYPVIARTFFKRQYLKNAFISPYVAKESKGVCLSIRF